MDIAFDESGYTGEHLLDPEQSVFALASCRLSEDDAKDMLDSFYRRFSGERKYSRIKKARRNWPLILDVLRDARLNSSTCKIYVINKPFMVVTKLIDNLYEPLAHEDGIDLYEKKAALATANLVAATFPTFLGKTRYGRLLRLYSECCRRKDEAAFNRFSAESERVFDYLNRKDPRVATIFSPVIKACRRGRRYIEHVVPESDHDPTIPAYYVLLEEWSKEMTETFRLIGDESRVLRQERERLLKFSDPELKEVEIRYYGASTVYPLKVQEVMIVESGSSHLVQMADFVAGASCHALNEKAATGKFDEYGETIAKLLLERGLIVGGLWPGTGVTPADLEATGEYGETPAEAVNKNETLPVTV